MLRNLFLFVYDAVDILSMTIRPDGEKSAFFRNRFIMVFGMKPSKQKKGCVV